ncbi:hypothetical protein [Nocardiopsis potens]|uniref:hypothetical protein n=1 Tax=Nocardiopsis potens TaxID=1246458 RepID=UPI00034795E3|nr:hypothetical protein [Nocardiopsis potens]
MNPDDTDDAVVRLCAQGMRAEAEGRPDDARDLFHRAWEAAADDYGACIAAHYLARQQATPEEALHWNRECLRRADLVGGERVAGFYPSLHLNIAKAHRDLGRPGPAREHYERAAARLPEAPPGQYADWLRYAVADGLRSTGAVPARPWAPELESLAARLGGRGECGGDGGSGGGGGLRALALILPALLGDLGTEEDRERLATALHMVHAARMLSGADQSALEEALRTVNGASA